DVDDADAAAGEERALEVEGRGDVPGRAAVHEHHVRGQLALRRHGGGVGRGEDVGVDGTPERALQALGARLGQVGDVGQLGQLAAQPLDAAGGGVDPHDRLRQVGSAGDADDRRAVRGQLRLPVRVGDLEVGELERLRVVDAEAHVALPVQNGEAPVAELRVRHAAELPQRAGELLLGRVEGLRGLAVQADLVDVPPAGPVG